MITLNGEISRIIETEHNGIVELVIPKWNIKHFEELDKDKQYNIKIQEVKSAKSLNQNNYAWALMTDIAKQMDMFPEPNDVYMQVLKLAKIKTEFIQAPDHEEVVKRLLRVFRTVVKRDTRVSEKGVDTAVYECSYGMSTFTKDEMREFIDKLLYFAEMNGVDTSHYDRYLR